MLLILAAGANVLASLLAFLQPLQTLGVASIKLEKATN